MVKQSDSSEANSLSSSDYERIGRDIETVVAQGHLNIKRFIFANFLRGVATGVGAIVGAALVVTFILWLLTILGEIPFIGDVFETIRNSITKNS
jgi:hypothetical protein